MTNPEATSSAANSEIVPCRHIAVRATFRYTRHHRQDWPFAIECLDLALLIDAGDEGSVGRGTDFRPD
jgi:hypothetical protein